MRLVEKLQLYGKLYRIYERTSVLSGENEVLLRVGTSDTVQSIGGVGPTGLYFDNAAEAVPLHFGNILLVGLGGGTVARLLRERGFRGRIWGIEPDPIIVTLARKYFEIDRHVDEVILATGEDFLDTCPLLFDCILLDAFDNGDKSVMGQKMYMSARKHIVSGGILLINDWSRKDGNNLIKENL